MEHIDHCKKMENCRPSSCKVVGGVLLAIATILTIITLNGLAIFGMFLVSMGFCCHKHMFNRCCCHGKNGECMTSCDVENKECHADVKKV